MKVRISIVVFVALFLVSPVLRAQKKALTHDDYDQWKSITEKKWSRDGNYLSYVIQPQKGDGVLTVHDLQYQNIKDFPRAYNAQFSYNSQFVVARMKPEFKIVQELKRKKTPKNKFPQDSLIVWSNADRQVVYASDSIYNFMLQKEGLPWLVYARKYNESQKTFDLHIRLLNERSDTSFCNVSNYTLSKCGGGVAFVSKRNTKDSTSLSAVYWFDYTTRKVVLLDSGKVSYEKLAVSQDGSQLAFLCSNDSLKAETRTYELCYFQNTLLKLSIDSTYMFEDTTQEIAGKSNLYFSDSGKRLYFGLSTRLPKPIKDTLMLDEDKAQVDVWSWNKLTQPRQKADLKNAKNRGYQAVLLLDKGNKVVKLEEKDVVDQVYIHTKDDYNFAIGYEDEPYEVTQAWDYPEKKDVFSVNVLTGTKTKILSRTNASLYQSPKGNFAVYYDSKLRNWMCVDLESGVISNRTEKIKFPLYDEENDVPSDPDAYGFAAWGDDETFFVVYDHYDLWKVFRDGKTKPKNLTKGVGRKNSICFRWQQLDAEKPYFPSSDSVPVMLLGVNQENYDMGIYKSYSKEMQPLQLEKTSSRYASILKSKGTSKILFTKENFTDFPDCYVTDWLNWNPQKITDANPQQKNYLWGTVTMQHWKSYSKRNLKGLLYKPDNFDSNKKYPVIVYYYEKSAETMNYYVVPQPLWSIVNISYLVSNGYVVFVPDVEFTIGEPGESAYDCIISGIDNLEKEPYIDAAHIGLQGQSWGGYETAYLITKTGSRFQAAMAGAPVSNMTSAYGGFRWGAGMSREFQYEQGQSRIGKTLWEAPELYIKNSPLFGAPNVQTPLLIMHNDKDDAVPWYQGIEFFMALRRLQKPVWMLVYNNEGHNLRERKNRMDLSIRTMQFFDYYLKGAAAPKWMINGVPATQKGEDYGYKLIETK